MAPAGNNKHCQQAMDDTFLLSNVVPQVRREFLKISYNCFIIETKYGTYRSAAS